MTLVWLIIQFVLTGLVTFGGGFVAITLLFDQFVIPGILTETFFYQMVTIAESTPGPIAINLATYIGFSQAGVLGGVITSWSFILPSFAILWLGYPLYRKYRDVKLVGFVTTGLRAIVFGMILVTLVNMVTTSVTTLVSVPLPSLILLGLSGLLLPQLKNRPYILLMIGAVFGVIFF
jgi:chromate transporter